jgi:hypothetical protein
MKKIRPWSPALALAAAVLMVGCEGDNLFKPLEGDPPEIVGLSAPAEVKAGSRLDVAVRAVGELAIDSIVVRVRGAFAGDQTSVMESVIYDAQVVATFDVPLAVLDTLATVTAIAYDINGQISVPAEDVVRVRDSTPPQVSVTDVTSSDEAIGAGTSLEVSLSASDNVGLARVGFRLLHENGDTLTSELVGTTGSSLDTTFVYVLAENVPEGDVMVEGLAEDLDGNMASSDASVPLAVVDLVAPEVEILYPAAGAEYSSGSVVDSVVVRVTDNLGVSEVHFTGVAVRGDPNLGTDQEVPRFEVTVASLSGLPADTTLRRQLTPLLDNTVEPAEIVVQAMDDRGNVGEARVSIQLTDGSPVVEILQPSDFFGYPSGDSILVRTRVSDNSSVTAMRLSGAAHRGDPSLGTEETIARFEPKEIVFSGQVSDTTVTRWLLPTPDSTSEDILLVVEADDDQGNMGADTITVRLGAPRIDVLSPVGGTIVQSGRAMGIRAQVTDPRGLQRVAIEVEGAVQDTFVYFPEGELEFMADTAVFIPLDALGPLVVRVSASNTLGISGTPNEVAVTVGEQGVADTIAPTIEMAVSNDGRLEVTDSIFISVSGEDDPDGTGIVKAGFSVRGISPSRGDTLLWGDEAAFSPPRTARVLRTFGFSPFNVDPSALPDTMVYQVTAYMIDDSGNCAAVTTLGSPESYPCTTLDGTGPDGAEITVVVADEKPGHDERAEVVTGRTVLLPDGGRIMDAVVQGDLMRLFLSNIQANEVEVFDLAQGQFEDRIDVGSEPWGMTLSRGGDSLIVANSGGTNVSVVDISTPGAFFEESRFFTPDVVLFDVKLEGGDSGLNWTVKEYPTNDGIRFSDRPQFVAVDMYGNIIYTTKTNLVGDLGTARKAYTTGGDPEVKLFVEHTQFDETQDNWALAHIDGIGVQIDSIGADPDGNVIYGGSVTLEDHLPGDLTNPLFGTGDAGSTGALSQAVGELREAGSDAFLASSTTWNTSFAFSDTTFVAASGDGRWVLIGEGSTEPVGRMLMYEAAQRDTVQLSTVRQVWDELTNASDKVRGIGLNHDGTLGVARGDQAYFFDERLRLQGVFDVPPGGAGAVLHPLHSDVAGLANPGGRTSDPNTQIAFLGSGERSIVIVDTWHFNKLGELVIRDDIAGPLKASLPLAMDNADPELTCNLVPVTDRYGSWIGDAVDLASSDDACVAVKLYGITSVGGVAVIDVRVSDIKGN